MEQMIQQLHFLRPGWLLLGPIAMLLVWMIWRSLYARSDWESQCDPALLKVLLIGGEAPRQRLPLFGLGLIWILAIIAMAGPVWERQPQPVYHNAQSRLLIFDLSLSMDSSDLQPSRLTRARFKLDDLVRDTTDRQQALAVFAGDAFIVSPFTDDSQTLRNLIPSLSTDTLPVQGSRSDLGLLAGQQLIHNAELSNVEVILITDGVSPATPEIAQQLASEGHRVSVLGVGTPQGAPIVLEGGGLLKDANGNIVIPGVDQNALRETALAGSGRYIAMTADNSDITQLNTGTRDFSLDELKAGNSSGVSGDIWIDRGAWLLLPLLVLMPLLFRKGWLLCGAMLLMPVSPDVQAFGWQDLWKRPDQIASDAMKKQQFDAVPDAASPGWRGAATYRKGQYEEALSHFDNPRTAREFYNRANALAKTSAFEEALSEYNKALELVPDMPDATHNRDLIQQLLEQQNQQQNSGQSENSEQSDAEQAEQNSGQPGQQDQKEGQESSQQTADQSQQQSDNPSGQSKDSEQTENPEQTQSLTDQQSEEKQQLHEQQTAELSDQQQQSDELAESEGQQQAMVQVSPMSEDQQALEQWLKKVPDDPGGLLRRKFNYQYSLRQNKVQNSQSW